jgi:hypothetical protein
MHVTLDGSPAAFGWSGCATLGELLARAEQACGSQGRVVTGLEADGVGLDLAARTFWTGRPLAEVQALSFTTEAVDPSLVATLDELKAHFPVLLRELEAAVEALRAGQEARAMEAMAGVAELWEACLAVAQGTVVALRVDLAQVRVGEEALSDRVARLGAAIAPLDEALRRKDLVLVADLCAYEIPPLVAQWEEAVGVLRALAEQGRTA